jgi:hypothetical protein
MFKTIAIAAAAVVSVAALSAQTELAPDTFKVNYYSNANGAGPDATVQITNVGTAIGTTGDADGHLCALIYVLKPDQQLTECCGCLVTADGLVTISVNLDLTSNPLSGALPTSGDIKIVSSLPTVTGCNPVMPSPASGIRAWATHIQSDSKNSTTETAFSDATLSAKELSGLVAGCKTAFGEGSGAGVCSCGTGE